MRKKESKSKDGLNILLVSNAGWSPSGYGTQIMSLAPRLRAAGHDIAISAFFGLQGGMITWNGIKHYPAGFQPYGNDVIHLHAKDFSADIVITLIDVWVLRPDLGRLVRMVPWTPIDHAPVPGIVRNHLRNSWAVMAYSQFAVDEIHKIGLEPYYIPHGVELDTFKPMIGAKRDLRLDYGLPKDAFIVGMVAANQSSTFPTRKGFERIIPAIVNLRRKGYTDLYLYIHTHPGQEMGGIPLIDTIKAFGADECVFVPKPDTFNTGGITRQELAKVYNMFDLYACPSMAEGFGLPLIEAQACGIPVIATKFSACKELCSSEWYIDPVTMIMTPMFSFQALPSVESITQRIAYAYDHPDELKEKGLIAQDFAKRYSWDTIVNDQWIPTLVEFRKKLDSENQVFETPEFAGVAP